VRHHSGAVLEGLDRIFRRGTVAGMGEGALLARFVADGDEAAFSALVARHGPMVRGVCRRLLRDEHDVDDAFQATFLVLVRRAGAIRDGDLVGHWLHGVAHRVAVRARAQAARRHVHEPTGSDTDRAEAEPQGEADRPELRSVLDEELERLPESLRAPMVLCYLEGTTHEEAASRLGWPVGTVRSRMARARDLLRGRLTRRGVACAGPAIASAVVAEPVSAALFDATVRASLLFATTRAASTVLASARAAAWAQGAVNAMTISKLKIVAAATLASVVTLTGVPTFARQFGGAGAQKPAEAVERSIDKFQKDLDEANKRNNQLQKDLQALRDELNALKNVQATGETKVAIPEHPAGTITTRAPGSVIGADGRLMSKSKAASTGSPGSATGGFPGGGGPGGTGPMGAYPGGGMGGYPGMGGRGMGMGGYPGGGMGMPGMAGKPARYLMGSGIVLMTSPEGDKATAYSIETGETKSIRLFDAKEPKHTVIPVMGLGIAAYYLEGPKINRIVAYSADDGTWYPQNLKEPVEKAQPLISNKLLAYGLGRRIYAFSAVAKRWDILELPEGSNPQPSVGFDLVTYEQDDHLYIFSAKTGKWADLDTSGKEDVKKGLGP
jgi:RNA polymerase sigma factor (sigma-70 family)